MTKVLMYNENNGEVKTTVAEVTGNVFKKYIIQGFKPIGYVHGFGVSATSLLGMLNDPSPHSKLINETYLKIKSTQHLANTLKK